MKLAWRSSPCAKAKIAAAEKAVTAARAQTASANLPTYDAIVRQFRTDLADCPPDAFDQLMEMYSVQLGLINEGNPGLHDKLISEIEERRQAGGA